MKLHDAHASQKSAGERERERERGREGEREGERARGAVFVNSFLLA